MSFSPRNGKVTLRSNLNFFFCAGTVLRLSQERAATGKCRAEHGTVWSLRNNYEQIPATRWIDQTRDLQYHQIHRAETPLRPIPPMINSRQDELAKCLAELLKPVVTHHSSHIVDGTSEFCSDLNKFTKDRDMRETKTTTNSHCHVCDMRDTHVFSIDISPLKSVY